MFIDPFSGRDISDDTFDERVIEYQLEREDIADRLDALAAAYVDGDADKSDVDDLRAQLDAYDSALDFMAEQSEAALYPDTDDTTPDYDDAVDFAGYDSDILDSYDVPDWWFDMFDFDEPVYEYEFGVDYEGD